MVEPSAEERGPAPGRAGLAGLAVEDQPRGDDLTVEPDEAPSPLTRLLESRTVELVLAVALVVIATAYLVRFLHAMATTSLWNDEIWSVQNFSSQGPGASTSTVNNAIVVSLVNSLLPGSGSFDPLRVRAVSMVAIAAMQVLGLVAFVRRRWFLPGALLFFAFGVNYAWLDTTLQARGYGVLGLCAMAASLATWRLLDGGRDRWLVAVAAASIIGVWTVPSFAFFAGPLWVLLIVVRRDRRVALAALGAGIIVLALYGPLIDDLWSQMNGYSSEYGYQYGTIVAPFRTVRNYLWERVGLSPRTLVWLLALVAPVLVALPSAAKAPAVVRGALAAVGVDAPLGARRTVRVLGVAAASVFVIALLLRTPPQRTVAYVVVPIAVITALSIAVLRDGRRFRSVARGFALVAGVLGCIAGVFAFADFRFTPIEDWRGAAAYIEATFPDSTPVHAVTRGDQLAAHLADGSRVTDHLDVGAVADGTVVIDAMDPTDAVGDVRDQLGDEASNLAQMDIPQRRGTRPPGSFPILFAPPADRLVERVDVNGEPVGALTDGDLGTSLDPAGSNGPTTLDVVLAPSTTARSLVVPLTAGDPPSAVAVEVTGADGSTWTAEASSVDVSKRLITVHLGDRQVRSVRLTVQPATSTTPAVPRDVWGYRP